MANDSEIPESQIAEWIGTYSPPPKRVPPPPGTCPKCKMHIDPNDVLEAGAWSGCSETGFAAGAILAVKCPNCGVDLRALHNVYDERGEIPEVPLPMELVWDLAEEFLK